MCMQKYSSITNDAEIIKNKMKLVLLGGGGGGGEVVHFFSPLEEKNHN